MAKKPEKKKTEAKKKVDVKKQEVKAAAPALGLEPDRLAIIIYQMVNLKRGGKEVRMSKRKGEFITLRDLLEEVGPDPIRFMLLTRTVDATIDFDLDLGDIHQEFGMNVFQAFNYL